MQRYDLRDHKDDFYTPMQKIIDELKDGECVIFLFEIGDFSCVQKSADLVKKSGCSLMNSLKFNQVDWTIVVKR